MVEVLFHVGSTTVRSKAEMLFPMWATKGCLQPFRFKEISDELRSNLQEDLTAMLTMSPGTTAGDPNLP